MGSGWRSPADTYHGGVSATFISASQNAEDVVLHRAMTATPDATLVEVIEPAGASAAQRLAERGWRCSRVTPDELAAAVAAGTSASADVIWFREPAAPELVAAAAASGPTVVVVTDPDETLPVPDGFTVAQFNGVSRYLVADGAAAAAQLRYPACSRDEYMSAAEAAADQLASEAAADVALWREAAVTAWADAVANVVAQHPQSSGSSEEIAALKATLSWRITRPLRGAKTLARTLARR